MSWQQQRCTTKKITQAARHSVSNDGPVRCNEVCTRRLENTIENYGTIRVLDSYCGTNDNRLNWKV